MRASAAQHGCQSFGNIHKEPHRKACLHQLRLWSLTRQLTWRQVLLEENANYPRGLGVKSGTGVAMGVMQLSSSSACSRSTSTA